MFPGHAFPLPVFDCLFDHTASNHKLAVRIWPESKAIAISTTRPCNYIVEFSEFLLVRRLVESEDIE